MLDYLIISFSFSQLQTLRVLTLILILQTISIISTHQTEKLKFQYKKNASEYKLLTFPFELDSCDD